jgi:hypothetical protein
VAKTVTKCLDLPGKKAGEGVDNANKELLDLAGDIDWEEAYLKDLESGDEEDDNIEGWVDEDDFLSEGECKELGQDILPMNDPTRYSGRLPLSCTRRRQHICLN